MSDQSYNDQACQEREQQDWLGPGSRTVFVSPQEKGAKEQLDKLQFEKAFVITKKSVWRQKKDFVGGANF